ncbi:tetratricopeptide repeat protein [Microscilla marina]|uniref:HTH luxR-type domain-containing protein n=1 Tax=Microscilla marina ATCC 23134 TaxID=313606 RepID=A1ZM23_MICM2|nr:hypothetical protein [Microscilla marina]EAY28555.1 hypothetical protein M23134_04402 [Microscilla marina ATCC 23134]
MKQLFFCIFILLSSFSAIAQTQETYQEHYQEAYEFANTGYDSISIYKSFYLLAYAANQACSHHRALHGYLQAQKYATDSAAYIDVNKNIANTFFNFGNYKKAKKITQQNIDFLQRHQSFKDLSYAYNLKGRILLEEKKESALPVLRQALGLRQKYAPERVTGIYESLAQAFFRFRAYDSAAYYQHQIITRLPTNAPTDKQAYHYATLAKYLSFDRRPDKALLWLQRAEQICCRQAEPALFVAQARALWQWASQNAQGAQADFKRLDSLMSAAMQAKTHLIDKRALNKKHIRLYRDILQAAALPTALHDKYAAKLEAAQAWYANYSQHLATQDQRRAQALAAQLAQARTQRWYGTRLPLYLGLGAVLLLAWFIYKGWQQRLLPEQRQLQHEKALIKTLRQKLGRQLSTNETQLATLMYRGKSFAELAALLGTNRDKVKYHAKKLADEARIESLFQFVTDFKAQRQKKPALKFWVKQPSGQTP